MERGRRQPTEMKRSGRISRMCAAGSSTTSISSKTAFSAFSCAQTDQPAINAWVEHLDHAVHFRACCKNAG